MYILINFNLSRLIVILYVFTFLYFHGRKYKRLHLLNTFTLENISLRIKILFIFLNDKSNISSIKKYCLYIVPALG